MGDPRPIRALTILQPWASLISHGPKRIENRVWEPPRALVGAFLAIHAGKRVDPECWEGADQLTSFAQIKHPVIDGLVEAEDLDARTGGNKHRRTYAAAAVPYGAVLAIARLAGVVRARREMARSGLGARTGHAGGPRSGIRARGQHARRRARSTRPGALATDRADVARRRGSRAGVAADRAADIPRRARRRAVELGCVV